MHWMGISVWIVIFFKTERLIMPRLLSCRRREEKKKEGRGWKTKTLFLEILWIVLYYFQFHAFFKWGARSIPRESDFYGRRWLYWRFTDTEPLFIGSAQPATLHSYYYYYCQNMEYGICKNTFVEKRDEKIEWNVT